MYILFDARDVRTRAAYDSGTDRLAALPAVALHAHCPPMLAEFVQRRAEALCQGIGSTRPVVVQEDDPRLLAEHMVVHGDNAEVALPQGADDGVYLRLQHRHVAGDVGAVA